MTNSESSCIINHKGIVQKKDEERVIITISAASACSGCHAEGSCGMMGKKEKIIEVYGKYNVKPGDQVTIQMNQSMGYTALLFGYVFPLISVIVVLMILISQHVSELLSGVISIASLIPYYTILFFLRKRINKKISFTLKD
jgi:positive regulator of sigma E activity